MSEAQARYRETNGAGATAVRLVVLLYDQMVRDLSRAIQAIERNDIEARTAAINHAVWVLGCLQGKLNLSEGGQVARNLELFYNRLRAKLVESQIKVSPQLLEQQITDILIVRDAWLEVEKAESPAVAPAKSAEELNPPDLTDRPHWTG